MAKIETIRASRGDFFDPKTNKLTEKYSVYEIFNISAAVGPGMSNRFGNVMVVQALIRYIDLDGSIEAAFAVSKEYDGAPDWYQYQKPQVTGSFDKNTERGIEVFQHAHGNYVLEHDGIVRSEPLGFGNNQKLTIYALNDAARAFYFKTNGGTRHTKIITELFPQVRAALLF